MGMFSKYTLEHWAERTNKAHLRCIFLIMISIILQGQEENILLVS